MQSGDVAMYVEYTGTMHYEIFADTTLNNDTELRTAARVQGIIMSQSLGFNNSNALGMLDSVAEKLHIRTIDDLKKHPHLICGFGNAFMDRNDGWRGVQQFYQLPQQKVQGMQHDIAYRALENGNVQVIDLYTTDAEISYYNIRTLQDNRGYFPRYDAVIVYHENILSNFPQIDSLLRLLENSLDERKMTSMNARVKLHGETEQQVAADFVQAQFGITQALMQPSLSMRLWQRTAEHVYLSGLSLLVAIIIALPLGIIAWKIHSLGSFILSFTGILQTIPSLALLVFMIPLFGIGTLPALVALFLYSLLPIVRNTHVGLSTISNDLQESALVLGLSPMVRLWKIELPLASHAILAGIRTAAVINIGTATLGALIGAGGYGQPILTGIRLDNIMLIMEGAVPAALLALIIQYGFLLIEKYALPRLS
jgi:osmoprotectant transport system permease protein